MEINNSPPSSPLHNAQIGEPIPCERLAEYSDSPPTSPVKDKDSNPLIDSDDDAVPSDAISNSSSGTMEPSSSPLKDLNVSPPSSPSQHVRKRPAYSAYKNDSLEPIPRQTLDRWKKRRLEGQDEMVQDEEENVGLSPSSEENYDTELGSELHHSSLLLQHDGEGDVVQNLATNEEFPPASPHEENSELVVSDSEIDEVYSDSDPEEAISGDSSHENSNGDVNSVLLDSDDSIGLALSDSEASDFSDDNDQNESNLYPGCNKSTNLAVLELLEIHIKNKTTKTTLKEFLKFYVSSLPAGHTMPRSIHHLMKYVENFSIPVKEIEHFYCYPAMHSVESRSNPCNVNSCGSVDIRIFYELPIDAQIKFFFEQRGLASVIDKYKEKRSNLRGKICDVVDGSEYVRVWHGVVAGYKVTLILNTDGVDPYKSSSAKLWPLMFTIIEVPPHLRSSFTVVWGIWFDKHKKPCMNMFLRPFASALMKINGEGGVVWKHPVTGVQHQSPIHAPLIVADAPARAAVLHMQEHQAKYACNTCEQKTNKLPAPPVVEGQKKNRRKRRFLYKENASQLRTHERMISQGQYVSQHGIESKKGMKGFATISTLPSLDLSTCVLAEYMHSVLKGVVLQFCTLWFFVKGDWYIGDHLQEINDFLCNDIHPPDYVTRLARALTYFSYFKANELRSLLLYYSLVIASKYMRDKYVQHWLLLVQAIFLLLQESISEDDLLSADAMLRLFVRDVGPLYGDEQYTYNVHQLTHLVLYVRRWGPLWATSAFMFENFNGILSKMIHGSKNEGKELLNQIFLAQAVQMLKNVVTHGMYEGHIDGIKVLGRPLSRCLTLAESTCLKDFDATKIRLYGRVSVGREMYSSEDYDKDMKRNNSWIECTYQGRKVYGRIVVFCTYENSVFCLVSVLRVVHTNFFFHRASLIRIKHMIPVEPTEEIISCDVGDLHQKLIQVGNYVCVRPNTVERNL